MDDRDETIRVFRPDAPPATHHRGDQIALDEVAPGLHLVLDEVFATLDPE